MADIRAATRERGSGKGTPVSQGIALKKEREQDMIQRIASCSTKAGEAAGMTKTGVEGVW
jgi:hypothetical protein